MKESVHANVDVVELWHNPLSVSVTGELWIHVTMHTSLSLYNTMSVQYKEVYNATYMSLYNVMQTQTAGLWSNNVLKIGT